MKMYPVLYAGMIEKFLAFIRPCQVAVMVATNQVGSYQPNENKSGHSRRTSWVRTYQAKSEQELGHIRIGQVILELPYDE